jgi:type IV secretion system protein TrbL
MPFALWNKTSFLAEKVLGNVVSSGIKVLVLAVIVGIGSGLFAEFQVHPDEPSIDHALVVMLASLALLALGIFGPGIATGLVSGAPQLGAGAMAGAAVGAVGTALPSAPPRRAWAAPSWPGHAWPRRPQAGRCGARAATSAASSARSAFQAGSAAAGGGAKGAAAGLGNVAKTGAQAGRPQRHLWRFRWAEGGRLLPRWLERHRSRQRRCWPRPAADGTAGSQKQEQPAWAKRMHRRQQLTHAATTAAHTLRGGDGGGSGQGPSLRDSDT